MRKYLSVILVIFSSLILAKTNSKNSTVTSHPITVNKTKLHAYERKLLARTKEGYYLVQDFYDTGEKLTDPYLRTNSMDLVILNTDNYDLTKLYVKDSDYKYRFMNRYDKYLTGKVTTWYSNGTKRSEELYKDGEPI